MAKELTEVLRDCKVRVDISVVARESGSSYQTVTIAKFVKEVGGDLKPAEVASFLLNASESVASHTVGRLWATVKNLVEEGKMGAASCELRCSSDLG